MSQAQANH